MRKIIFILIIAIPLLVQSQSDQNSFSMQEAIAYALENNYQAINADRDILDAQKQKWQTIASGLPQINGQIAYQNQLKQPVSQIPAEFFGGEPGTFQTVVFGQPQSASATATLTQQIFNGSYIVGVQATKTFIEYYENNKEKTEQDVIKAVVETYGNVLLSKESVVILKKNKETLDKMLYEAKRIFENGLGDEESVDQLQITYTSIDNQLKNAQRLELITEKMLNLMLGRQIGSPIELSDNLDALTQEQINFSLLDSEFQIENNIDFKLVQNLNEQRQLELKLAKSYALPSLNAFVNFGVNAFGESFEFFDTDLPWFRSSILGVQLDVPIFSSLGRSAGTQRAKIALDKAKTQFEEVQQQIWLQLETAKSNYILAIEEYDTSKQSLKLAERIENKNQIKYSEGLASSFELQQAQNQLYASQQEYLQSMVNVINQKVELETILNK